MNWETEEVINWLINDEGAYFEVLGREADDIRAWVLAGNAPQGLYDSFLQEPYSSFDDVEWETVAEYVEE